MHTRDNAGALIRETLDWGLFLLAGAYLVAALIGLPLFGDGGYYFFKLATDGTPLVPNLRFTALLPQLPGWAATAVTADPLLLRHVFSIGYQALPWLSLLACWLIVRRRRPALMLFPLLSLAVTLLNFSAVSELISGLYLVWPLVLSMALLPERAWVRVYLFLCAPLLFALHPMAFVLAFGLAAAALAIARRDPFRRHLLRGPWPWLAVWIGLLGLARLTWTAVGANDYERGNLTGAGLVHYLVPATLAQALFVIAVLLCALLALGVGRRPADAGRGALADWGLTLACASVTLLAVAVSAEFLAGQGIKLKAAATFVAAVLLMGLAFGIGRKAPLGPAGGTAPAAPAGTWDPSIWPYRLIVTTLLLLVLAKSAAWWTGTRGLQDVVADSAGACIPFAVDRPFGLQWPWMGIIDDWVAPMHALAFRPRIPRADGRGIEPIPLLLPDAGCRELERTGDAYLTDWVHRPWTLLDDRFGPLRRPGSR